MADPAARFAAAVEARARSGARRAGLLIVASLLLAVAAGFLSVAIWIVTATAWSPLVAALVLGGIYLGGGLLALVLSMPPRPSLAEQAKAAAQTKAAAKTAPFPPLAEAFVFGLDTALRLRRSRDRDRDRSRDRDRDR